jgi:hypothetical protein
MFFQIDGTEYELYQSASNDWCVSVTKYGKDRDDYNIGTKEDALAFILSDYAVD